MIDIDIFRLEGEQELSGNNQPIGLANKYPIGL